MKKVYTIYSFEDKELKDVVTSLEKAKNWVVENREGNEDDCRIESWSVDFENEEENEND